MENPKNLNKGLGGAKFEFNGSLNSDSSSNQDDEPNEIVASTFI
jgi:hypothetical protein